MIRIVIPLPQVWLFLDGDLLWSPRAMCVNSSMNRTEARLMCVNRLIQPLHEFRRIESVDMKASVVLLMYLIDRIRPVTSCIETTEPSRNPEFHNDEMLGGVGRSIIDLFRLFMMFSFFFISFVFRIWFARVIGDLKRRMLWIPWQLLGG